MIGNSSNASHFARMKISDYNININKNTPHNKYISLYFDDNKIKVVGDIKNINMTNKELEEYKKLYLRNKELIEIVYKDNSKIDSYNKAFIHDEKLRNDNYNVIRDKNGDAQISKDGEDSYKINLRGKRYAKDKN